MSRHEEFRKRLVNEVLRGPQIPAYSPIMFLDDAIEVALEQIEEWDYEDDKHGWCHQRPILITLLAFHLDEDKT